MEAYNRGDAKGVASYYTEDGKVMPPGMETQIGREGQYLNVICYFVYIRIWGCVESHYGITVALILRICFKYLVD